MQGGGAYIASGGSANFTDCIIHDNEGYGVHARILNFLDPSSSAPLNSDTCAVLTRSTSVLAFEPSGPFFHRPAGTLRN